MRSDKINEKGMTLVEILAALVILGIVFIGFMTVFPQMTNFNEKTEDKLVSMNLAKKELFDIKRNPNYLFQRDSEEIEITDDILVKRFIYQKDKDFLYEVDYFTDPDLDGRSVTEAVSLFKIHIKVKKDGKISSETYGYIKQ